MGYWDYKEHRTWWVFGGGVCLGVGLQKIASLNLNIGILFVILTLLPIGLFIYYYKGGK